MTQFSRERDHQEWTHPGPQQTRVIHPPIPRRLVPAWLTPELVLVLVTLAMFTAMVALYIGGKVGR